MMTWYRIPLFQLLARRFSDLTVLFIRPDQLPTYSPNQRTPVRTTIEGAKVKLLRSIPLLPPPYPERTSLRVILDIIRSRYNVVVWGASIVNVEALFSFTALKLLRRRIIIWIDEWGWRKPLLRRLYDPVARLILRHADACIAHGVRHKRYYLSLGIPEEKIFLSGSVSLARRSPDTKLLARKILNELGWSGKKVILYVGGLIERKGVHYLIKAFKKVLEKHGNARLLIVGQGPRENSLKQLCRRLKVDGYVRFMGWVNNQNIPPYYHLCDVFVLPSVTIVGASWNYEEAGAEPWGLVLNEAMSMGKPVIATTAVGAAEDLIVNGANGFVVRERDALALSRAIHL
jgi:glycosyltransferase involved in cell wall biosynthesis